MKKILLLALIVGVVFLYGCKEDALQEPEIVVTANSLSLDPAFSKAAVGDEFVLSVMAKDVSPIAGWQFSLSYDPEVLEAKGVSEGDFLKGADGRTYWVAPKMNPGSIENAAAPLLSGGMRDGSGVVATVKFVAKAAGQTDLKFFDVKFADSNAQEVAVTSIDGVVWVS